MAPPSMPSRSLSSTLTSYEKQLDQALAKYPSMLKLERKLGVPKARIVAGAGLAVAAYALLHLAASMLIALVVFAYPAFMTMRAMESGSKSEHSLWLAYWVSAAALQLTEAFSMGALGHLIPFYTILKLALHMWLYLPATQVRLVFICPITIISLGSPDCLRIRPPPHLQEPGGEPAVRRGCRQVRLHGQ